MFEGKTVLVTGATSGIGNMVSRDLAQAGARLIAVGRNEAKLEEIAGYSSNVRTIKADLARLEDYPSAFDLGEKIDGLVCSAGRYETTLIRFFAAQKHDDIMRINLTASLVLIAELMKQKAFNSGASIVLLSSILGPINGLIGSVSYAASKAALVGAAKTLALELAKYSIRVNCVSPGMVATEMTDELGYMSSQARQADMARYPLGGRYATAAEVSSVVRFLLSGEAGFMTGSNVVIDGGCSVQ